MPQKSCDKNCLECKFDVCKYDLEDDPNVQQQKRKMDWKKYYAAHSEIIKQRSKKYYAENREFILAKANKHYQEYKAEISARRKELYLEKKRGVGNDN